MQNASWGLNPFKPEFTIVIFIHYKPRIAVAILDLKWMKMTWNGWKMKQLYVILKSFFSLDAKWCFNASWGFNP